ncbi:peptidase domain-containing ABC transporter [Hymenobacter sp. CRA2]|uniref:peptidase domain-containing ABC transporter n=1 Tax=Hymenobacter sp. CRA2 TaxID=1955620 RepID=UPI00098F359F|nr:peptidase domain-containing ABC transporter [Hymenobacter sp. CRA2]OON66021.1 ABC transporter ATP-binding protein [Hymenobacter sp. CRA2]
MAKFPHYRQHDIMDCGPTCLRMIARHYGRSIPVQTLREKGQLAREGTSLLGLAEAAEAVGFRTMGVEMEMSSLVEEAPLPCIVLWDQNHYVVVHDVKKPPSWARWRGKLRTRSRKTSAHQETFYVADPGRGLLTYSAEEFQEHWAADAQQGAHTGIALLLETTPAFYEQEDEAPAPSYGFERLLGYVLQHKQLIGQLLLGLVVAAGLQLLLPFLTQAVVDVGVNTQNVPFLYLILGAQLVLLLGRLAVEFVRSWILLYISTRLNLNILSDFFIKLMRLPVAYFDTKHYGDLMQRISDHHRIESFLTGQALNIVLSLLNLVVFGVVLALYNTTIFLVFAGSSVLYLGWIRLFLRQRRKLDEKRFAASARSQSMLVQLIQGMQEIKLAGAERPMRWAWERLQARLFKLQMKSLSLQQYQQAGAFALNEGKNVFITFLAAKAVIDGQLTLGAMLAMQYMVGQLNGPVEQLVSFVQNLQDAQLSVERLNEIHTMADEEPEGTLALAPPVPAGSVATEQQALHLRNVSFTYPGAGQVTVLDGVNLSIPSGRTTAIVGMSGSGKTTLLKLLLKFYAPSEGDIRVGNVALRNVSHAGWRQQCGVVMQDGFLFSDTIARNIAVGVESIDAAQLAHAVHVANLEDFIGTLPLGLHTKIGADGSGISQGQRQRILIARAVYKNPQYLFFDEATNALDANNEAVIWGRLQEFFRGRTVVVVAHRLSTVSHADQLVVLDKGRLTESGTHASLIAQRGQYWHLVKNQLALGA